MNLSREQLNDPENSHLSPGVYLIPTPIGNLGDMPPRSTAVLREVDLIACEDTRRSRILLDYLDIEKPLVAYHEHNEKSMARELADQVEGGKKIALISDGGTPGISDPGFRITRECRRRGLNVIALPGPTAVTTALVGSGLPTDAWFFAGFLPPKSAGRKKFFQEWLNFPHTIILLESPYRILKFLEDFLQVAGSERWMSVARELSKYHEEQVTLRSGEMLAFWQDRKIKGEFVIVVAPSGFDI